MRERSCCSRAVKGHVFGLSLLAADLHGRIVQERQSSRPEHPQFGHYELEQILAAFRDRGFVVTGEIRPRDISVTDAADRVVAAVREPVASGVPADHITVRASART